MQCSPIISRLLSWRVGFPALMSSEQQTVRMSIEYRHNAMVDGAKFQQNFRFHRMV
jgi:hypothetical protein